MMKKILSILFCFITLPVFAIIIDANTQLRWNSEVVDRCAKSACYNCGDKYQVIYYKLMADLLERERFSVSDAVSVCMKYCGNSEFEVSNMPAPKLRDCPDVCRMFGRNLATNMLDYNEKQTAYGPETKIYSADRKFFAVVHLDTENDCFGVVYDANTNKQVAECIGNWDSELMPYTLYFKKTDNKYKDQDFSVFCNANQIGSPWYDPIEKVEDCYLVVNYSDEFIRKNYYDVYYKPCADALKEVDLESLSRMIHSGIFPKDVRNMLSKISLAAKKFDFNKVNVSMPDPDYEKYCKPLEGLGVSGPEQKTLKFNISTYIEQNQESLSRVQSFFQQSETKYLYANFSNYKEAEKFIERDFNVSTGLTYNIECHSDPYGAGTVKCKLGTLEKTFQIFGDKNSSEEHSSSETQKEGKGNLLKGVISIISPF